MRKLDMEKVSKLSTTNDLLEEKYGKEGTASKAEFDVKITDMQKNQIYILSDRTAIDYILNGEIDELKEYLTEPDNFVELSEPISFETEAEVAAF